MPPEAGLTGGQPGSEEMLLGVALLQDLLALTALGFARGWGAFMILPLLAAAQFPRPVRLALPVALLPALLAFQLPAARELLPPAGDTLILLGWLLAELAIGLVLTLPVAALFWAAQSAGELIDIKTGANNNALFGTGADSPVGPAQVLFTQLAVLVLVAHDGLHAMAAAIWRSYEIIPIGRYGDIQLARLPEMMVGLIDRVMWATLHLFGPFLIVFLLIESGVGLISKLAQQLQVDGITAPVKSLLFPALLLLMLFDPRLLGLPAEWSLVQLGQWLPELLGR